MKLKVVVLGIAATLAPAHGQRLLFHRQFPTYTNHSGVAVDSTGVYTLREAGVSAGNQVVSLTKYSSGGAELWSRAFVTAAISFAGGVAVARDGIYVVGTGTSSPARLDWDIFAGKYDANGTLLWRRQIDLPTNDVARGVAADVSGAYVIGQLENGGLVRKYDGSGGEVWTRQLTVPQNRYHAPLSVAADLSGVHLAGVIEPPGQLHTAFVRKYNADGSELWDRQFGQLASGVAVDSSGVYVAGWTAAPLAGSTGSGDSFLRRYDASGNELWTRQFGRGMYGPGGSASALALDATGIYVVGSMSGSLPGHCRAGGSDAVVTKFDGNGNELWARQFGTHINDAADAVTVDANAVYISGSSLLVKAEKTAEAPAESRPRILPGCVVNAANYLGGGIAPGEIVTIFGSAMGPTQLMSSRVTEEGRLATELAQARVLFNGVPAPLLYVSASQSSAIVPFAIAGQSSVDVQLEYQGVKSDPMTVTVLPARPGLFTRDASGIGQANAINEDGTPNSPMNPAAKGSVITLFATGEGLSSPRVADGTVLANNLPKPALNIYVAFADYNQNAWTMPAEVTFAGGVEGTVAGLLQIKVRVPQEAAAGEAVSVFLSVGSREFQLGVEGNVTVAIR